MIRRLPIILALLVTAGLSFADSGPALSPQEKVAAVLIKALAEGSAKELHPLCDKGIQDRLPVNTMEVVLRSLRNKYGKVTGALETVATEKNRRVFRARGEKQEFFLRLNFDKDDHISGWSFVPTFLHDLPAGPLTLAEVQKRLTAAVEHTLRVYRVPSVSLALVKGDQTVWVQAFGFQNLAKSVPADTETAYSTGSTFKVVVATALMQLVDEGKLELDAPLSQYLKKLTIPSDFEKETPLTLRHVLSHRGGLVPYGAQIVNVWKREVPTPVEELLKKRLKVTTKPGEKFGYSNLGYTLGGYLLGQVRETTFDAAVRNRLLDPLGMTRTVFEPTPAIVENLAVPYENAAGDKVVATHRTRLDVYPAGDVYSTPSDMARFVALHLNNGKVGDKQVVSAASVSMMRQLQFAKKDERTGQGLGWMIGSFRGRPLLWHNGAVPGFFSYIAAEPQKKLGVVLFCNKYNPLEAVFGALVDPLVDLRELALELLDRLEPPATAVGRE